MGLGEAQERSFASHGSFCSALRVGDMFKTNTD